MIDPVQLTWLVIYVGGALGISFLCSLLEAGLLSVRDSQLAADAKRGHKGAALLLRIKQGRVDDAISAILTLNTIAHTIGATLAGAQAAVVFGDVWVGVFSAVLTVLVLVVTEIVPKTIGTLHALRLAGFVAYVTRGLMFALAPILVVTRWITRLLAPATKPPISPTEISALVTMAVHQGTVPQEHQRLFDNVLALDSIRVSDIMTPHTVTAMLPHTTTLAEFVSARNARSFSRIPLYGESRDDVTGYVLQRQVLDAVIAGADLTTALSQYQCDPWFVPEIAKVNDMLRNLINRREHLAMVIDEYGLVTGIVTLEDVVETFLGVEIVDETDPAVDMRALATRIRDERLKNDSPAAEATTDSAPATAEE